MARAVSRQRRKEGRGIGEILSEYFVYIVAFIGLILLANWYFRVYLRSPQTALLSFLGAVKSGSVDKQYDLIADSTKRAGFPTQEAYDRKSPLAHGLSGRLAEYQITNLKESADKATADVTMTVRKTGQELYQAGTDQFKDIYLLQKESSGWKVALEQSQLQSLNAAPRM